MQRHVSDDDEPLHDTTTKLTLRSKRTDRLQRKKASRDQKRSARTSLISIIDLPTELILEALKLVRPSDVITFSAVNRRFRSLVVAHSNVLGNHIIRQRYHILQQCFPLPVLLTQVPPAIQSLLTDPRRQKQFSIHHKPYQHVQSSDPQSLCTCLTCILTWNNLNLVLDFARWQDNLDNGVPVPILPRGRSVDWNEELVARNARIVRNALRSPLWHAYILETHLESTVRSIRRHQANKGNKRKHVDMSDEEADVGTDGFLAKAGPLSLEFPYNRDEYYMLEAYLPNRWWKNAERAWRYTIAGQHERDLEMVVRFATR